MKNILPALRWMSILILFSLFACSTRQTHPLSEPASDSLASDYLSLSEPASDSLASDYLYAALWYQRGVEAKANIIIQYKLAGMMLDRALQSPDWTAAPEEQQGDYQNKPPAVILDVDETVLDNSPFMSWLAVNNFYYDSIHQPDWNRWIDAAKCPALPGALEFIHAAEAQNVKVFYVTNRPASQQDATRRNLQAVGLNVTNDDIYLKKEQPDWGSPKGSRRKVIADHYRILLLIGDNLGDFVDGYKASYDKREEFLNMDAYGQLWGEKWIMLPNPLYGSWEQAAFDHKPDGKNRSEIRKSMKSFLHVWDGK